ncbi:MAG TPA: LapA family protein [Pusillimonas sp.]|uniref:LapA family protein n=1 Tax=Pusillimonas sp. TaxID=3040095 RepID=UPI002CB965C7|nr:LapA family protein [Pusillimonas sp.]HUH88434.1 LapA family protein [Pusillimonas sp.]
MRYVIWAVRLVVFVLVLLFALKNTDPVDVGLYADHVIRAVPLIVVMLVAFALGAVFAALLVMPSAMRRRREAARLRREVLRLQEEAARKPHVDDATVAADVVPPLAPL